jgi:hypothetical protein
VANYTGLQRTLISKAGEYVKLGYRIGFSKGKAFLSEYVVSTTTVMTMFGPYQTQGEVEAPDDFDGISVIPEDFVCVDIDVNDFGVIWMGSLPPTWKERTPRGWHLFYNIPAPIFAMGQRCSPERTTKIKWQPHVDLLIKGPPPKNKKRSAYSGMKEDGSPWGEHVLISPTPGYERKWPEDKPKKTELAMAPQWLVDALEKP